MNTRYVAPEQKLGDAAEGRMKNLPDSKWAADCNLILAKRETEYLPPLGICLSCSSTRALRFSAAQCAPLITKTVAQKAMAAIGLNTWAIKPQIPRGQCWGLSQENDEAQMTNDESMTKLECLHRANGAVFDFVISGFFRHSLFEFRHLFLIRLDMTRRSAGITMRKYAAFC
jgi:hypothetical protein